MVAKEVGVSQQISKKNMKKDSKTYHTNRLHKKAEIDVLISDKIYKP